MVDGLDRFVALISEINDDDLTSLRCAAESVPQFVPGFLSWFEHAVGWELDRRAGFNYRLGWPTEAIPPEEEAASVVAALALAAPFRDSAKTDAGKIADLLDHVATLIGPDGRVLN